MVVSYVSRKCTSCGGRLESVKENKIWRCLYCGAESEREEQYDGMFSVKNVVRQVISDLSFRRIDSAAKNLIECEKIDSKYIGTMIAKMCYQMIFAITPGACEPSAIKGLMSQLKGTYEQFSAFGESITEEEEILYDFFQSDDVLATLLLVYDSLGDHSRRDFLLQQLNFSKVFSQESNKSLIVYMLNNSRYDFLNQILKNRSNIDHRHALLEVLSRHVDDENKLGHIRGLIPVAALKGEDRTVFEKYLYSSTDSTQTKGQVVAMAYSHEIKPSMKIVMETILSHGNRETVGLVLRSRCNSKISDDELLMLVEFAYGNSRIEITIEILSVLNATGQLIVLSPKHFDQMFLRKDIRLEDKLLLMDRSFGFRVDTKTKDAIIGNYLCFISESFEIREVMLQRLLIHIRDIPTSTVENYVLRVDFDGDKKSRVVEMLLELPLNISFFNSMIAQYLTSGLDTPETRHAVIVSFASKGLKVDSNALSEYVCNSSDAIMLKIKLLIYLLNNGSLLRRDIPNMYLEVSTANSFDADLFRLIYNSSCLITDKALSNYALYFNDSEPLRVKSIAAMLAQNVDPISISCEILHRDKRLRSNIAQAYILVTNDSMETAREILQSLIAAKIRLNGDIFVVEQGNERFKKYVLSCKEHLGPVSLGLCEENKVFSMLF